MTITLATVRTHIRLLLADPESRTWTDADLDEAIRQALAELAGAAGAPIPLEGLDGEAGPSGLTAEQAQTLAGGAAGYAVLSRALRRAEAVDLGQTVPATLLDWAHARLKAFRAQVLALRLVTLQRSTQPPYAPWSDPDESTPWR